jgi:hypothetical protein
MRCYSAMRSKADRIPRQKPRNYRRGAGTRGETMRYVFRWRAKKFLRWSCWARA